VARAVLADTADPLVVSTQVLAEFYWVTTRRLQRPLDEGVAAEIVAGLSELRVIGADAELVLSAIALARERELASWDALVVRAAQVARCDRLLSEDLHPGSMFGGVRVENPFAGV
jgi:predicted nucleic acid-binding protein